MQQKFPLISFFSLGVFFVSLLSAQQKKDFVIQKNSLSFNLLGTGSYLGISYERVLSSRLVAEIGLGIIGYGAGISFYPIEISKENQVAPFLGLKYTNHAMVDGQNKSATYFPLGFTFFSKNLFNISIDIGPSFFNFKSPGFRPTPLELERYPYKDFGIWGNAKLGFRFTSIKL